ncbi:MAG: CCA tRNA nucleotidyltransferase, partial [Candidatus Moranbacteria bacterium]|nr:CCA tRNA nucleotidyltransferase [Candidatus Moranbacteria bacterium]
MINSTNQKKPPIPSEILEIARKLSGKDFEVYLVGGSVRDLLLGQETKDFDLATSAKPREILKLFPDSFYNNVFGTVGIKTASGIVETTTFRKDGAYSDQRHPDKISFAQTIEEDLKRRDFTVNALALDLNDIGVKARNYALPQEEIRLSQKTIRFADTLSSQKINQGPGIEGEEKNLIEITEIPQLGLGDYPVYRIPRVTFPTKPKISTRKKITDLFSGLADLEKGLIRAVGDPEKRFQEDALRLVRAIRFAVELGFKIEKGTADSIRKNGLLLKKISRERVRDELIKIMESAWPAEGIVLLHQLGLLKYVLPTLEEGVGVEQNWHHIYSVFNHSILSLKFCFSDELPVRLAALLHDAAKPRVKRIGKGAQATFHFHEVEGEKMARKILHDLRFPSDIVTEVALLVRHHMFNYDPALHNEKTVRRLLHRVGGGERMARLLVLRIGDRLGSGCKKGEVYKLRKLK